MNEIGIRELKAKASELVRHVAEDHAVYTITRRGRPVGVLAPADFVAAKGRAAGREAWARLLAMADRMAKQPGPRKSALEELFKMRREQLERAPKAVRACKPDAAARLLRKTRANSSG